MTLFKFQVTSRGVATQILKYCLLKYIFKNITKKLQKRNFTNIFYQLLDISSNPRILGDHTWGCNPQVEKH